MQAADKIFPFQVTYSAQALPKKVRNLKACLVENPGVSFAIYLYRGPLKFDKKDKILFLPYWMI